MIEAENVIKIIEVLPELIIYIVPGYIVIWMKSFILSHKQKETNDIFIKSIVLSYLLTLISHNKLVLIILSIIIGYCLGRFLSSDKCSIILKGLGVNKTFHACIWEDISDLEYGMWINIYLPNELIIYQGKLRKYEEKEVGQDRFIVLSNYITFDYDSIELENCRNKDNRMVMVNTKNISRIELYYHQDSNKI